MGNNNTGASSTAPEEESNPPPETTTLKSGAADGGSDVWKASVRRLFGRPLQAPAPSAAELAQAAARRGEMDYVRLEACMQTLQARLRLLRATSQVKFARARELRDQPGKASKQFARQCWHDGQQLDGKAVEAERILNMLEMINLRLQESDVTRDTVAVLRLGNAVLAERIASTPLALVDATQRELERLLDQVADRSDALAQPLDTGGVLDEAEADAFFAETAEPLLLLPPTATVRTEPAIAATTTRPRPAEATNDEEEPQEAEMDLIPL